MVIVVGPTASGKSGLAVELSQKLAAPIINADSRQVYAELNVGVAKPTPAQLAAAPHQLVGHRSIHAPYSAGRWSREAAAALAAHFQSHPGGFAIVSGGSGLHIKLLVDGVPPMPAVPNHVREQYEQLLAKHGIEHLQQLLLQDDPAYYQEVALDNPRRLVRALSVIAASGRRFSELRAQPAHPLPYRTVWIKLDPDTEVLYPRINARVDTMIAAGLEQEARQLYSFRHLEALQTIGYRELFEFFDGTISFAEAQELIKRNTRHYARRQRTWNRRLPGLTLAAPDVDAVLAYIRSSS